MGNLLFELVKLILLPILKAKLLGDKKFIAEVDQSIQSYREHQSRLDKILESLCTSDPNDFRCKEYFERYPERRPKPEKMEQP
ncbi:MAG: hypothetical protein IT261_08860 [Saprospiraceae bacterium]|nr:hypothetical protein [Saprospiraceae bacterium]